MFEAMMAAAFLVTVFCFGFALLALISDLIEEFRESKRTRNRNTRNRNRRIK